jgi:hypothetical protein
MNNELQPVVTDGPWGRAKQPITPHPAFSKNEVWRLTLRYSDGFRDTAKFVEFYRDLPPLPEIGSAKDGVGGWLVSTEAEMIKFTND